MPDDRGNHDPLADEFRKAVEGFDSRAGDVRRALVGGRRRKTFRRAGALAGALVVVVGALVAISAMPDRQAAPPAGDSAANDDLAEVFVFRALDASRMLNLSGDYYGIGEVTRDGNEWDVTLEPRYCVVVPGVAETCRLKPGSQASLVVAIANNELSIVDARGDIDSDSKAALERFHAPATAGPPGWLTSTPSIGGPKGDSVEAALAWRGPIPYLGHGEECRGQVAVDGSIVWSSEWREMPPPSTEATRTGGTFGFSGIPDQYRSGSPEITCRDLDGLGWQVAATPGAVRLEKDADRVAVAADLEWTGVPYSQEYTRCTATVRDAADQALGEGVEWLTGPGADESGPPFDKSVLVFVPGVDPGSAASAEMTCSPVSSEDYETRDG